jgi:hypothetical protein
MVKVPGVVGGLTISKPLATAHFRPRAVAFWSIFNALLPHLPVGAEFITTNSGCMPAHIV